MTKEPKHAETGLKSPAKTLHLHTNLLSSMIKRRNDKAAEARGNRLEKPDEDPSSAHEFIMFDGQR